MLNRFSNITLLVLCGLLVVGIVITRRVDTAIEWKVKTQTENRAVVLDFKVACTGESRPLLATDTAQWKQVRYTLPNYNSYTLERANGFWQIGTDATNVQNTAHYLGKIAAAQWRCGVEHSKPEVLKVADYVLDIVTLNDDTLSYRTYVVDTFYIIQDNSGQLYSGNADSLFWQLYFGKHRFIPVAQ